MAVRWYGSTAYGSAVVRQYGRTCIANGIWRYSCTAVSVKCTEHCIRRTATRHTAHDERQYGVRWRTGGVGELGVRRTAHGVRHGVLTVHSTQPGEQGSDARQQGIRSTRSIPGSKEQTNKQTIPVSVPLSVPFPAEQMLGTSQRITGSRPSIKNSNNINIT